MSPTRKLVLAISGVAAVAMLIASIALLVWVLQPRPAPTDTGAAAGRRDATTAPVASTNNPDSARPAAAKAGPRVTLRLGQGFRFADGAKLGGTDENCDVAFRYQPPRAGGLGMQYNTSSREFEPKFQSTLDAPFPLLVAAHAKEFESPPDVSKVTTGDVAAFPQQAALYSKARYAVLQTRTGEHYLLTLGEIEAGPRKLEDWRVGFDYERLTLPLGAAGGRVNQPLPGRLVFRDWYRTKMVVRVDLTTGAEDAVADGVVPSVGGDGLLGLFDSAGSYVVRDPAGKVARTTRFDERLWHAALSPDGTRLLATVSRAGPPVPIGFVAVAGPSVTGLAAFDVVTGKDAFVVSGYDDAAWAPDGAVIATGAGRDDGLFEIDLNTKVVRPIDARLRAPTSPAVSPDGRTIAFVTGGRVWLIDRDGRNLRQLLLDGQAQLRPTFSPDGTRIAMIVCNQPGIDYTGDVVVVDIATGRLTPVRTRAGQSLIPDDTSRLNWVP